MKKHSARMRTRAKQKTVASDRARRPNVPRHILFYKCLAPDNLNRIERLFYQRIYLLFQISL